MNRFERITKPGANVKWLARADDPLLLYKKMKYGAYTPKHEIEEADILAASGIRKEVNRAKNIYMSLLRLRSDMLIHRRLIPLLSAAEALQMAEQYQNKSIKNLYYDRALQLNPKLKPAYARRYPARTWTKRSIWVLVLLILLGLGGAILYWWTAHQRIQNNFISTVRTIRNNVYYVTALPSTKPNEGTLQVPSLTQNDIIQQVDNGSIPIGTSAILQNPQQQTVGVANHPARGMYNVWLLNPANTPSHVSVSVPTATAMPTDLLPWQLNSLRTAYAFYLDTHNHTPPQDIHALKPDIPNAHWLNEVNYQPSLTPAQAIQPKSGRSIPYQSPIIEINLSTRTLKYVYDGQVLLSTQIGQGSPAHPTPNGRFEVTGRMTKPKSGVYGPYVFPLNFSAYAIHGTNHAAKIGQRHSLGCVEVANTADAKLYGMISCGIPVVISGGSQPKNPASFLS